MNAINAIKQNRRVATISAIKCNWTLIILTGLLLLICVLLNEFVWASVISFLTFAFFVGAIIYEKPNILFEYFAFFFACVGNVVGVAVVEFFQSFYLYELRCDSGFVGSLPLLLLGWWTLLVVLYVFSFTKSSERATDRKPNKFFETFLPILTVPVLIINIAMFIHVFPNPSFEIGVDRFEYKEVYLTGIWEKISGYLPFLMIFPILSVREGNKKIGITAIVFFCLYLFWVGTKFSDFFTLACLFMLVYANKLRQLEKTKLRKYVFSAGVILVALIGLAGFAHSFTSTKTTEQFYSDRTAQQGQIWWKVYDVSQGNLHTEEFFKNEIPALSIRKPIDESVSANYGIYKAMYLSAPTSTIDTKLSSGSRYTEAGFACAYYYFGPIGVVAFGFFMAFLVVAIVNAILRAISGQKVIDVLIQVRFYSFVRTALSMFIFSSFFSKVSLLCFVYLIFTKLLKRRSDFKIKHPRMGILKVESL